MSRTAASLLVLLGLFIAACQEPRDGAPAGEGSSSPAAASPAAAPTRWPFRPATLHIHPLTRFAKDPARPGSYVLEARIEFLDEWDAPTKAMGMLTLELTDRTTSRSPLFGNFDLSDLERNAQQYEPITLSYLIPLRPDWPELPEAGTRLRLRAFVLTPEEEKLQDQLDLTWPVAPPDSAVTDRE